MAKKENHLRVRHRRRFGRGLDWLLGGGDSPSDIQRGIFATEVGVPRLLRLFKKYKLQTTFFIPGHSIETFPDQVKQIADEGHEIGAHGYCTKIRSP